MLKLQLGAPPLRPQWGLGALLNLIGMYQLHQLDGRVGVSPAGLWRNPWSVALPQWLVDCLRPTVDFLWGSQRVIRTRVTVELARDSLHPCSAAIFNSLSYRRHGWAPFRFTAPQPNKRHVTAARVRKGFLEMLDRCDFFRAWSSLRHNRPWPLAVVPLHWLSAWRWLTGDAAGASGRDGWAALKFR